VLGPGAEGKAQSQVLQSSSGARRSITLPRAVTRGGKGPIPRGAGPFPPWTRAGAGAGAGAGAVAGAGQRELLPRGRVARERRARVLRARGVASLDVSMPSSAREEEGKRGTPSSLPDQPADPMDVDTGHITLPDSTVQNSTVSDSTGSTGVTHELSPGCAGPTLDHGRPADRVGSLEQSPISALSQESDTLSLTPHRGLAGGGISDSVDSTAVAGNSADADGSSTVLSVQAAEEGGALDSALGSMPSFKDRLVSLNVSLNVEPAEARQDMGEGGGVPGEPSAHPGQPGGTGGKEASQEASSSPWLPKMRKSTSR